jgi:CzcA family heavy metal efflux pump
MSLASWLESHRRSLVAAAAVLALGGLASLRSLPVGLFPATTFPRVVVSVDSGDRPAERMIIEVTRPIEEAVRGVPGVRNVRSTTSRGTCDVSVDFAWGTDMVAATLQVDSAITHVAGALPSGTAFQTRRMDPFVFPVLGLSLASTENRSLVELRDRALYELAPRLSSVTGVSRVAVQGGRSAEFQVLLDPARLDAVDLTLEDVVRSISASNVVEAVGRLEQDERLYLLLADTQVSDVTTLGDVILRSDARGVVQLEDVAEIRAGTAPEWTRVTAAGVEAVLLNVYQQPDGNTVQIARDVAERLREYARGLPPDLHVATWYDQSELIEGSVGAVRDAILVGAGLAIAVIAAFLGSWRVTLVVALAAPATLAITLLLLGALGMTLNIMTLGGIAASVGLVVDDAIVVIEHAMRRLRSGDGGDRRTIFASAREMLVPLTGSSIVTTVIFVPLAYLSGVTGAFFRPLALTMALALAVSYGVALLVVPVLIHALVRRQDAERDDVGPRFARFLRGYDAALRRLVAKPRDAGIAIAIALILGALAFERLGTGFLPQLDEGGFVLDYRAPAGTSLSETDRQLREVERILADTPEVATYSRRTGLALGGFITEANEGDFFVRLKPPPRHGIEEVIDDVRARVEREVPGLEVELPQLVEDLIGDLTAVPQPIEVKFFASDAAPLRTLAERVAERLHKVPGVVDTKSGVVLAGDAVRIGVDRMRAQALGLDPEQVTRLARIALQGDVATQLQRSEKMVGVRVWTAAEARGSVERIGRLRLRAADGTTASLERIATLTRVTGEPQITRENLKTMVAVTGRISGRDLGSAMDDVKREVAKLELPAGTYVEYGGLYGEQQRSFRSLSAVLAAATLLVALVLLFLYESAQALLAVAAVGAVAGSAVFVGLWLTGSELNVASLMGLTMVVGVTSETSVFFLSHWRESRSRLGHEAALLDAARSRVRPILMTGLAAALALSPLALGIGRGSAMLQPLAIAILSGLVATVPAVLLLLPPLLAALERTEDSASREP